MKVTMSEDQIDSLVSLLENFDFDTKISTFKKQQDTIALELSKIQKHLKDYENINFNNYNSSDGFNSDIMEVD